MPNDIGLTSQRGTDNEQEVNYYLLKAEPDSRVVKGKDVKFSVDDFEKIGTSPWEGVRNFEARNIMREMKVGDKALFYHSNCKIPGIAAFATVSREAYPDFTAWDPNHPYYDVKSDQTNPKWYMVDLTFTSRAKHFVPLALLRYIATVQLSADKTSDSVPDLIEEISYLGRKGVVAVKGMGLVMRGRLSVQRVKQEEWDAINLLSERGGWEDLDLKKLGVSSVSKSKGRTSVKVDAKSRRKQKGSAMAAEVEDGNNGGAEEFVEEGGKRDSGTRQSLKRIRDFDGEVDETDSERRTSRRIASQTSGATGTRRRKVI